METGHPPAPNDLVNSGPHSLGKLIEWKPKYCEVMRMVVSGPHSLGKLIEWKQNVHIPGLSAILCPHSLGKLIEWKLSLITRLAIATPLSPLAGETN